MKATTKIVLDTRRILNDSNLYPVKLRVTFNRYPKYYTLDYHCTKEDWPKIEKGKGSFKNLYFKLVERLKYANDIIENLEGFTFDSFERKFRKSVAVEEGDVYSLFENYILQLKKERRVGTASAYNTAMNSLKQFKSQLALQDITPDLLNEYEAHMKEQSHSLTTVGIYLRGLRTIVNMAIETGLLKREKYPFGKKKYVIPGGVNIKKALTKEEVQKIITYKPEPGTNEGMAVDYWLFIYCCNGMNMKDVCRLKYKNLQGDKLVFFRAKTERTRKENPTPITVSLNSLARDIIKRQAQKKESTDTYLFPMLTGDLSAEIERDKIQLITKVVNKWMKRIAEKLSIEKPVTTYTARHTFGSRLRDMGAHLTQIQEFYGHASAKTTELYLANVDDGTRSKYADELIAF